MTHLAAERAIPSLEMPSFKRRDASDLRSRLTVFSPGLFRLFLACLVFAQHSTRLLLGAGAVFLFFGLSGYWIAAIWEKDYASTESPAFTFYVSRAWRLLPAFWVANLFAIVIAVFRGTLPAGYRTFALTPHSFAGVGSNLALLGYALLPHTQRLLDPAWSLDVEAQFYLLFPMLMLMRPAWRARALFLAGFIGLCAIVLFGEPVYRNLGYYLFFFGVGLYFHHSQKVPSRSLALGGLAIALLCLCLCCALPEMRGLVLASKHAVGESARWSYAANCAFAFLMVPFAFRTVHQPSPKRDRLLGDLSYLVYLFHVPVLALLGDSYFNLSLRERLPWLVFAWVGVFAISIVFWAFVHRPLEQRRKRFVSGRKSSAAGPEELPSACAAARARPIPQESTAIVS